MEDPVVDEGVRSSERPVDYSKAKFSIEFLLEKAPSHYPPQSILIRKNSEARTAGSCNASGYTTTALEDFQHSRSATPESLDQAETSADGSGHPLLLHDERRKRPRTAFTAAQIKTLESEFDANKYLSVVKRIELSKMLGLTQQQLKVWYQNRRTKWKRKYANDLESMAQQYYSSMGISGSRPMLIGDRLWIFNTPQETSSNFRRGVVGPPSSPALVLPNYSLPASAKTSTSFHPSFGLFPGPATPIQPFTAVSHPKFPPTQATQTSSKLSD